MNYDWSYALNQYTDKCPYDSNCIEYWGSVQERAVHGIKPNQYWVSTYGRVMSITRYGKKILRPVILKSINLPEYRMNLVNNAVLSIRADYLVMMTFCYIDLMDQQYYYEDNDQEKRLAMIIVHKDGDYSNNKLSNLEWKMKDNWVDNIMASIVNSPSFGKPKRVRDITNEPLRVL